MSICELQVVESALPPRATEKWMSPGLMGTEQGVLTLDESPIALNTHTHTPDTNTEGENREYSGNTICKNHRLENSHLRTNTLFIQLVSCIT